MNTVLFCYRWWQCFSVEWFSVMLMVFIIIVWWVTYLLHTTICVCMCTVDWYIHIDKCMDACYVFSWPNFFQGRKTPRRPYRSIQRSDVDFYMITSYIMFRLICMFIRMWFHSFVELSVIIFFLILGTFKFLYSYFKLL